MLALSFTVAATAFGAEEAIPSLRPPRDELRASFWQEHGGWVVVIAIILAVAATVWARWNRRPKPAIVQSPEVVARAALEPLRGSAEDSALVAKVSRIVRE